MRRVVILAPDDFQALDAIGPAEVFDVAGTIAGAPEYAVSLVAPGGGQLRTSSGLRLIVDDLPAPAAADTLLVAGGRGTRRAATDPQTVAWVRDQATRSRRVTSVCSGAFVLAAAGLLDGRRATTHWGWCDTLAEMFPAVVVEPDPIFVRDGHVWTSAGVTAGMDLALALVEEDLGADVALEVARWLVLFLKRPGGQSQFSGALAGQRAERRSLCDLQAWMATNVGADLGVPALAARVHLSERQFARAFKRETGRTPGAYVEELRVERARQLLQSTPLDLESVARAVGISSAEVLRRAFHRRLGVSPAAYRERFAAAA